MDRPTARVAAAPRDAPALRSPCGGETVSRVLAVERIHHAVALGLGDDRRGGDREIDAVALVELVLRNLDARHGARVHQHVLRAPRQRLDRAAHREQRRVIDVDLVDFLDGRLPRRCPTPWRESPCATAQRRVSAGRASWNRRRRRYRSRGGNITAAATTGPASGPHARLVDARDVAHARLPQHELEMPHRLQPQPLVALAFEALLQRLVQARGRPAANRAAAASGSAPIPACRLR